MAFSTAVLQGLDHAIILVRDLEAASASYASLLGRKPSWRGEHPEGGTTNALYRLDNTCLELLCPDPGCASARLLEARLEERGEGLIGLAFGTDDARQCRVAMAERGLHPRPPIRGSGRNLESGAVREWESVLLPGDETRGLLLFALRHLSPPGLLPAAGLAASARSAVTGVDHVVVRTSDAEAARKLYADQLGIRLALDRSFEQWGARMLFFRTGGVTVEVVAPLDDRAAEGVADELWGIAYRVPSADGARARLAGAGFDVSESRPGRKAGTRVFTVRSGTCGVATLCIEAEPGTRDAPAVDGETASAS